MTIGSCRDEDRKEAFELWGIYMEPCFKKLGIGRRLVAYCEDVAKIRGHGEILLWVLEGNLDSRAFYEKCGYRPEGTVKTLENLGVNEIRYIKKI